METGGDAAKEMNGPFAGEWGLPWGRGTTPLMLAPMQGLTNRALRALFAERVKPDVVFTEFMRVNNGAPQRRLSASDLKEIAPPAETTLVVQLVGHGAESLAAAAATVQAAGAVHLNLNMGCPYGRTGGGLTGGKMLKRPELLGEVLRALREAVSGSFSVKLRAGYDDPQQVFSLLPLFEAAGVDFIILHPRTVVQEYRGSADHAITARVVEETTLPVIANGDIRDAETAWRVLGETGAAGLMLGRGAIADPLLFRRIRRELPDRPDALQRARELRRYILDLFPGYRELFCGDHQVLAKLKAVLAPMDDPDLSETLKGLRRARNLADFLSLLHRLPEGAEG
jgi:tRNA-dihydrouridine synthase B